MNTQSTNQQVLDIIKSSGRKGIAIAEISKKLSETRGKTTRAIRSLRREGNNIREKEDGSLYLARVRLSQEQQRAFLSRQYFELGASAFTDAKK